MKKISISLLLIISLFSCKNEKRLMHMNKEPLPFETGSLNDEMPPVKEVKGQLLYLPVYSNVPYQIDTLLFDMSAFVAIHNTDLNRSLKLTKVLYFNQDGKLVTDFLKDDIVEIGPLATKDFYIPYEDQSGTGANFLIEWTSDSLIYEPLIESVTLSLKPNNTIAVLSQGKIIREIK